MTKIAFGAIDPRTVTAPRYTYCNGCRLSVCVHCWECVALELDKLFASTRGIVMHDVFHVLLTRAFSTFSGRCRGFEFRNGGGGTWVTCCPLCVVIRFEPPSPPRPLTISGREYGMEPPRIEATRRFATPWKLWFEDATCGETADNDASARHA